MSKKKSLFGVNTYRFRTPKKRPGRYKKNLNKHAKRMTKKYRGQGR